jgi:hypothetical protein
MTNPTPKGRPLSTDDLWNILNGACILGCGGGGPLALGKLLLEEVIKKGTVYLADPVKDVGDSDLMAIAAGIGSPLAAEQGFPFDVATIAVNGLEKQVGKTFSFVLPGEVGAGNSIIPMTVAVSKGIAVVDADGAGRAIPELDMDTYTTHDLPISPIVLANSDVAITFYAPNPTVAGVTVDGIIGGGTFQEDAGAALWAMDGKTMKPAAIHNTLSYALKLGQTLGQNTGPGKNPVEAVRAYLGGTVIFSGEIAKVEQQTSGGFDYGVITFASSTGKQRLTIYNQNENLIAWNTEWPKPIALAPDLVTYLTTDGQPFTNADLNLAKGKEIAIIAAPCRPEMRNPRIVAAFRKSLHKLGYAGPYVPFEDLQAEREPSLPSAA